MTTHCLRECKQDEGQHTALIKITFSYALAISGILVLSYACLYHPFYDAFFIIVVLLTSILTLLGWIWTFAWRVEIFETTKWVFASIFFLTLGSLAFLIANGIVVQQYGRLARSTTAYNVSVTEIQNYKTNKFVFSDGVVLTNATWCFYLKSRTGYAYFAVAPLVANAQNFSNQMIPAFVFKEIGNPHCILPHDITWQQPIRQGIRDHLDISVAIPDIYRILNMPFDSKALHAPVIIWENVADVERISKRQAVLCFFISLGLCTAGYVVSLFYYIFTNITGGKYKKISNPRLSVSI
eukprot:Phypoly_transcript_09197.p1 GENE.Phypoly_transcript_09197~~Phypoly_transcript_09197.p1  ORF type:complete len:304 (+),score=17.37 Phypoly_transcript_09197:25-912(+)